MKFVSCWILLLVLLLRLQAGERINQDGRILGPPPTLSQPVLFNTPEADAILSAMQIFPVTHPWNEDISRRPVLTNSDAMIAQITSDLSSSRRTLRLFYEMNFVLIPDNQPLEPIEFVDYPEESDPSPYPLPWTMPIETWPRETGDLTLQQWQLDAQDDGGDRHAIVVQPAAGFLWEMWQAKLINADPSASLNWQAANGAKFNLNSNALRPAGWTSGDAAGLAMFPALVRYEECRRGMVEHAMRLVVKRTRIGPIYPATHQASVGNLTDANIPAMGQRLRLKASFNIPATWTLYEQAVARGLKKYGAIVADNGNFFSISVTPDDRYPSDAFAHLSTLSISNFEVIQTTGPDQGPRSASAPQADAGPDLAAAVGASTTLEGSVSYSGPAPTLGWRIYSGPATVQFDHPSLARPAVRFTVPGVYTLMFSADDGVHAVAYDATVVTVTAGITAWLERTDPTTATLRWTGGSPPYTVEVATNWPSMEWQSLAASNATSVTVSLTLERQYLRVRGQ